MRGTYRKAKIFKISWPSFSDTDQRLKFCSLGGSIAQWLALLFVDPAAPGSIPNVPDAAEINHRNCLEESGQLLENTDPTHLVLGIT